MAVSSLGHSRNFSRPPKLCNQATQKIGGLPVIPSGPKPVMHNFQLRPTMPNLPALKPAKTGINGKAANSKLPRSRS